MTVNCGGKLIDISTPKVMGILNVTPDSFYDGGKYKSDMAILLQTEKMLKEGATFIDVGAYSSRPGANQVAEDEELNRLLPIVELILKNFPETLLSIDTFRSEVAKLCIELGACMINDISAGKLDDNMIPLIGALGVPYIMMHMKGTPQNMQSQLQYKDLIRDIIYYFSERVKLAKKHQIKDIIIDPGFGFSKTLQQNYNLLHQLELLQILNLPILVGVSRKSMIYNLLETVPNEALNGTTVINTIALLKGANIIRVHDVKEAMDCVSIVNQLNS
jgi:dihydropteroate synthase